MRIDLEKPSEEHLKDQEENRLNLTATSTCLLIDEHNKNLEPHDGMEFESKEETFSFYKEYAKFVGFATIIKASRRSRITGKFIDAKFVCTRYGSKRESSRSENLESDTLPLKKKRGRINRSWSKTDCKACMHVKRIQDGRWVIRNFIKDHNHEMYNTADALNSIRGRTKKMYMMSSKQSGRTKKTSNKKNSIVNKSGKCLNLSEGDTQVLLDYFMYIQEENPESCYAIDLNLERRLKNVFWIDAKARVDFESFADVVFFDTTYIKNECKLPFVPFLGVNHHFQFILFGCALIADESESTFIFVMRAWRRAMGGKAPKVILSDQEGLKDAIAEVFPESRHCFCLWHILSKIQDKLSYVTRKHENLTTKFCKCVVKSGTEEIFEKKWWKMVDRFDLRNDTWVQSLYEDREKWVPVYMRDIFLGGMSTAQRSESLNSFDKCMQRKTNLKDFLEQYKGILHEKYEDEARADLDTWHKQIGLKSPSPFGKQMSNIYTHAVFKKFQVEVLGVVACHPKKENKNVSKNGTELYNVQDFEENRSFVVLWDQTKADLSCSCRLFEYNGFLCRHVMIVLQMSGVHDIPSRYILKRLTKDAKNQETQVDFLESRVERFSEICKRCFKLSDEGSLCLENYDIAFDALEAALRKCVNKKSASGKERVQTEPEVITIGIHDNWQQTGQSKFISPALDCSYELRESIQGLEQLNSRVSTLDGYFGTQSIVPGMEQLNDGGPSRDDYYENQQNIQGLGQLNSIAPMDDGHYLAQQRLHVLGQLNFRPQTIQSCFDLQDSLHDMHESDVGPTPLSTSLSSG